MTVQGRVTFFLICCDCCSSARGSRYSLRNFTEFLFHCAHLFEILKEALGLVLVDDADSESDVDQDVFSDFGFGDVSKIDIFPDAAEVDLPDAEGDVASVNDFYQTARNGQTHKETSAAKAAILTVFLRHARRHAPIRLVLALLSHALPVRGQNTPHYRP